MLAFLPWQRVKQGEVALPQYEIDAIKEQLTGFIFWEVVSEPGEFHYRDITAAPSPPTGDKPHTSPSGIHPKKKPE